MKKIRAILKIGKILSVIFLVILGLIAIFPLLPPFRGWYKTRAVLTGSMRPAILPGSLIITRWYEDKDLKEGDIITYRRPDQDNFYITHRIVKKEKEGELYFFQTKGDQVSASDQWRIHQGLIEGKVILTLPFLGYFYTFAKSYLGFAILIGLPAILIIADELKKIRKILKEKKTKKNINLKRGFILVLASCFFFAQVFLSFSYFSSSAVALEGITLSTMVWDFDPPSSTISKPFDGQYTNQTTLNIVGTAEDADSQITKVEVGITPNGEPISWQLATGTTSWSYFWTILAEGAYQIQSRATDNGLPTPNTETPSSGVEVIVDWTAPESEVDFLPDYQNNSQFSIDYTTLDNLSGVDRVLLYYRYQDGEWILVATDEDVTGSFAFTASNGDGEYEFFSIAIDNTGNIEDDIDGDGVLEKDEFPLFDTFTTVDTTPPVTMLSVSEPRRTSGDLVVNGGFETGDLTGWGSGGDGVVETTTSAHGGNYSALIGFPEGVLPPDDKLGVSYIEQLINWISGIPTVSLWYRLQTDETAGESFFSAWLKDPFGLIEPIEIIHDGWDDVLLYPSDRIDLGWKEVTYQANEFKDNGQMKFYCEVVDKSEGLYSTWTFLDDVKVTTGDNLIAGTTKLSLSSSDASGSGVVKTKYNLDGSGWFDYLDSIQVASESGHVLEYRSIDDVGNSEEIKKINLKATHKVVINEVYYHGSAEKEWVELYNASSGTVNLKGWQIFDNYSEDDLPNVNLASGKFAVIFYDHNNDGLPAIGFSIDPGAVLIALNSPIGNGLADVGDKVVLKDNADQEIDAMSYGNDTSVFTLAGVANGNSLARKPKGIDTDTAGDWEDLATPNPGTNPHTRLDFYLQPSKAAVGFKISGIKQYQKVDYQISYDSANGPQGIVGAIEVLEEDETAREGFTLGTCSAGGTCIYHSGIDVIHLRITLVNDRTERILEKEINYE